MNKDLLVFWHTTWSAWRSGALSSISQRYAKYAKAGYQDFIKLNSYPNDPAIAAFFDTNTPRPGEFFIEFFQLENNPVIVLTSQRLWLLNSDLRSIKETSELIALELRDVDTVDSKPGWYCRRVTIRFKDKTEKQYDKIAVVYHDMINLVLKESKNPNGWVINLIPIEAENPDAPQAKESPLPFTMSLVGGRIAIGFLYGLAVLIVLGVPFIFMSVLALNRGAGPRILNDPEYLHRIAFWIFAGGFFSGFSFGFPNRLAPQRINYGWRPQIVGIATTGIIAFIGIVAGMYGRAWEVAAGLFLGCMLGALVWLFCPGSYNNH